MGQVQRPGGIPAARWHPSGPPAHGSCRRLTPRHCFLVVYPSLSCPPPAPLTVSHPTSLCPCREPEAEAKAEAEQNIESVEQVAAEETAAAVEAEEEEKVGKHSATHIAVDAHTACCQKVLGLGCSAERLLCCCGGEPGGMAAGRWVDMGSVQPSCAPGDTCVLAQQLCPRLTSSVLA